MFALSSSPGPQSLSPPQRRLFWAAIWLLGAVLGGAVLSQHAVESARDAFYTDARIAHRLMSQRAVQHEAVLATLGLMQPLADVRLPAVYPQFLSVLRRLPGQRWAHPADASLAAAEAANPQASGKPMLGPLDFKSGRFWLLQAGKKNGLDGGAYGLEISLPLMVPWAEWPMGETPDVSPVRVLLRHQGQSWVLQTGAPASGGLRFSFSKPLAAESHPFELQAERWFSAGDLPWLGFALWSALWAALVFGLASWQRQRHAQRRAEELVRLGQVSRLNALGEMAAGLAHELNQPLTAVLANTQAAARLLDDAEPDLDTARQAMTQAVQQGKRAAEVVARLRRSIERPDIGANSQPVDLVAAARNVMLLLEPEARRRNLALNLHADAAVSVRADPVALQQIIHNLIDNALRALENIEQRPRRVDIRVTMAAKVGRLEVEDNGPGVPEALLGRLFEPFVTSRPGGLGLGLSLCETLSGEMGGQLRHELPEAGRPGARFILELPLAAPPAAATQAENRP